MKSPAEVQEEIAALRALVPTGDFTAKTYRLIGYAINELEHPRVHDGDGWEDLEEDEKDMRLSVQAWLYGIDKPSEGWGTLVEKKI